MMSEEIEYRYRPRGSNDWHRFGIYNFMSRDGMNPLAVDAALDAAYVLDKLNGRTALYRVPLDGSGRRELLVSHDEVDVDGVLRLGRRGRVVGATYATDRRQMVYFDPELRDARRAAVAGDAESAADPLRRRAPTMRAFS